MSATVAFPTLQTDLTSAISPRQVTPDRYLLFLMVAVIAIVQGEFLQGREVAFDAVQPGGPCGCEVKFNSMAGGIGQNLCLQMEAGIIQHNMQDFAAAVTAPQPLEKAQKGNPVFVPGKLSNQRITLQIIGSKHVSDPTLAAVGGSQAVHMTALSVMFTVTGLKVQRAKFIHGNTSSAFGPPGVKPPKSLIFGPELRITRILPGFGMPPADFGSAKYLSQPFQRYGGNYLLGYQVFLQLGQRPDIHADQLLWRGQGYLADLFSNLREKFLRSRTATVIRIPGDGVDTFLVEAVDDLTNPSGCAAASLGNISVATPATREQNNSGVSGVDSIGQLSFHTLKFLAFPGPQPPCYYLVHVWFSTFFAAAPCSRSGEPMYTIYCAGARPLYCDTYKRETL